MTDHKVKQQGHSRKKYRRSKGWKPQTLLSANAAPPNFILQSFSAIRGKMIKQEIAVEPTSPTIASIAPILPVQDPFAGDSTTSTVQPMMLGRVKARAARNARTTSSRRRLLTGTLGA